MIAVSLAMSFTLEIVLLRVNLPILSNKRLAR
jgi:hypothetical protein